MGRNDDMELTYAEATQQSLEETVQEVFWHSVSVPRPSGRGAKTAQDDGAIDGQYHAPTAYFTTFHQEANVAEVSSWILYKRCP